MDNKPLLSSIWKRGVRAPELYGVTSTANPQGLAKRSSSRDKNQESSPAAHQSIIGGSYEFSDGEKEVPRYLK